MTQHIDPNKKSLRGRDELPPEWYSALGRMIRRNLWWIGLVAFVLIFFVWPILSDGPLHDHYHDMRR